MRYLRHEKICEAKSEHLFMSGDGQYIKGELDLRFQNPKISRILLSCVAYISSFVDLTRTS